MRKTTYSEFKRNCPKCKSILYYSNISNLQFAEKNKRVCLSCSLKNRIIWNKGLTKETDARVAKYAKTSTGSKRSKDTCENISKSLKGRIFTEEWKKNISNGKKGKTNNHKTNCNCPFCNPKSIRRWNNKNFIHRQDCKCQKCRPLIGDLNSAKRPDVRKKISKRVSETHWDSSGKNNPSWIDGRSYEPYTFEFNKKLKEKIRQRDLDMCYLCEYTQFEHLRDFGCSLHIHHINYDKKDSNINNLITLCQRCNIFVNNYRTFWQKILENVLKVDKEVYNEN